MAKQDNLPFPIGTTFFDGQTADTTTNTAITLEGKEYTTEDLDYSKTGAKPYRSARLRKLMIVRNVSGIAILPMRLVTLQITGTDGKFALGRVDGYCTTGPGGNVLPPWPRPTSTTPPARFRWETGWYPRRQRRAKRPRQATLQPRAWPRAPSPRQPRRWRT